MKNYVWAIAAAILAVCSCEKTVRIMDIISDDSISALKTTDVEVVNDEIVMINGADVTTLYIVQNASCKYASAGKSP